MLVAVAITVTGCTTSAPPPTKETEMSAQAHKKALADLFAETQNAVGGTWKSEVIGSNDCTTRGGEAGQQYALEDSGPGRDDGETAVHQVKALWDSKGYSAEIVGRPTENSIVLTHATDADSFTIQFGVSAHAMFLGGSSACGEPDR